MKCYGRVYDSVVRRCPLIDGGGVDVGFERRSDLAQRLRGAIELGEAEVAASDHGFDFAGRIVDGNERALDSGILFEADVRLAAGIERQDFYVEDIAGAKKSVEFEFGCGSGCELRSDLLSGPRCNLGGRERGCVLSESNLRRRG